MKTIVISLCLLVVITAPVQSVGPWQPWDGFPGQAPDDETDAPETPLGDLVPESDLSDTPGFYFSSGSQNGRREYQPDQREYQPDQREHQPDQSEDQPDQSEDQPDQRKHQSNQRKYQPDQSEHQPDQREYQPDQREDQPDQSEHQPDQRDYQPDQSDDESEDREPSGFDLKHTPFFVGELLRHLEKQFPLETMQLMQSPISDTVARAVMSLASMPADQDDDVSPRVDLVQATAKAKKMVEFFSEAILSTHPEDIGQFLDRVTAAIDHRASLLAGMDDDTAVSEVRDGLTEAEMVAMNSAELFYRKFLQTDAERADEEQASLAPEMEDE